MPTTDEKIEAIEDKIADAKLEAIETKLERLGYEDPNHPVWKLSMLIVCSLLILGIFALTAQDFSLDDIMRFLAILPVIISGIYNTNILKALSQKKE